MRFVTRGTGRAIAAGARAAAVSFVVLAVFVAFAPESHAAEPDAADPTIAAQDAADWTGASASVEADSAAPSGDDSASQPDEDPLPSDESQPDVEGPPFVADGSVTAVGVPDDSPNAVAPDQTEPTVELVADAPTATVPAPTDPAPAPLGNEDAIETSTMPTAPEAGNHAEDAAAAADAEPVTAVSSEPLAEPVADPAPAAAPAGTPTPPQAEASDAADAGTPADEPARVAARDTAAQFDPGDARPTTAPADDIATNAIPNAADGTKATPSMRRSRTDGRVTGSDLLLARILGRHFDRVSGDLFDRLFGPIPDRLSGDALDVVSGRIAAIAPALHAAVARIMSGPLVDLGHDSPAARGPISIPTSGVPAELSPSAGVIDAAAFLPSDQAPLPPLTSPVPQPLTAGGPISDGDAGGVPALGLVLVPPAAASTIPAQAGRSTDATATPPAAAAVPRAGTRMNIGRKPATHATPSQSQSSARTSTQPRVAAELTVPAFPTATVNHVGQETPSTLTDAARGLTRALHAELWTASSGHENRATAGADVPGVPLEPGSPDPVRTFPTPASTRAAAGTSTVGATLLLALAGIAALLQRFTSIRLYLAATSGHRAFFIEPLPLPG